MYSISEHWGIPGLFVCLFKDESYAIQHKTGNWKKERLVERDRSGMHIIVSFGS